MATPPTGNAKAEKPLPEIEIEPDAWERFKSAVHKVAASPPKPRKKVAKEKR